jgi:hypothetical protein
MQQYKHLGIDFIGPFVPSKGIQYKYNIVATNTFTKWVEERATRIAIDEVTTEFLFEETLCRFDCLIQLMILNYVVNQ